VRATLAVLAATATALVTAPAAPSHGGEIISKAIEALRADPVYVDETAVPTLAPDEADRLRERIRGAGGRIYVAVLPADAQHELPTADAVVEEIAAAIGGESTFAVLVGGQFRAASVDVPEEAEELEQEALAAVDADAATRLRAFVDGIAEARSEGASPAVAAASIAAVVVVAAVLVGLLRRRSRPEIG
jgi:hypothetical protein